MIELYFVKIQELLKEIQISQKKEMTEAAGWLAEAIQNEVIIHLFGCGHSHIFGEEVFFRAGGLAAVSPIFHEPLMLHEGAARASQIERKNDYASKFLSEVDFQPQDVLFVISTSGRNPVPVDVALYAKEKGTKIVVITSRTYANSQESRHTSGQHLHDVGDLVIDNLAPIGDAILSLDEIAVPFGPVSTVVGVTILQAIFSEAIKKMVANDFDPPIFLSGNIEGSDEHNQRLLDKYGKRIPLLVAGLE